MKLNELDLVIFDMDGLIFDTEAIYIEKGKEISERYGYNVTIDVMMTTIGMNDTNASQVYRKHYGEEFPYEQISGEIELYITSLGESGKLPFMKGAKEIIHYLYDKNIKIAVATSSKREKVELLLKNSNILDKFNYVICGDDIVNSKPNPEIFIKCAIHLDVDIDKTIVLEDSYNGIKAASSANMKPIMIPDQIKPNDEIRSLCYAIHNDLFELIEFLEK